MIRSVVILAAILAGTAAAQENGDVLADQLKARLSQQGYEVLEGTTDVVGISDCNRFLPTFGNCFGNNPAAPYLVVTTPYWNDEYVDRQYGSVVTLDGTNFGSRRIRADEAIVILGRTGPAAAYTGIQSYLFSRRGEPGKNIFAKVLGILSPDTRDLFFAVSPNPDRFMLFASLGDSINNAVIAAKLGAASGFAQEIGVISTPNPEVAGVITQSLGALNFPANRIHVEKLPSDLRLGHGAAADDVMTLIRYALPQDEAKGNAWRHSAPFKVLRVRPAQQKSQVPNFGPIATSRRSGADESRYENALDQLTAMARLVLRIPASAQQSKFVSTSMIQLNGPECIRNRMNCLGDSQDTDSYRFSPTLQLGPQDVIVVTGINHAETGNATYVSLSLNNSDILMGVESASQTGSMAGFLSGSLKGSAERIFRLSPLPPLPALAAYGDKLYVQLFARDCARLPNCETISPETLSYDATALVMQRAYLRPGATTGADPDAMVSPRIVIWRR